MLCLTQACSAETQSPLLTFDQALNIAIRNNPQFKAEQARLHVWQAAVKTAGARPNPYLMTDNGIAERTYRLGVEQLLETGGKRRHRVDLAKTQLQFAQSEVNTRLLELRANVRRAYTQLYNVQERQKTYQNILTVTQELVDIAQKREQAGDIATLDVLQTEIINVNTNNELQSIAVELTQAQNHMNALLNQPLGHTLIVAPPNTTPQLEASTGPVSQTPSGPLLHGSVQVMDLNLDRLIQTAIKRRPELKSNTIQLETAQQEMSLAKANRIPNIRLAVGPDWVTGSGGAFGAFVVGNVEIPMFNRQQGPILEALARKNQYNQEQEALKNKITLEVTAAYTAFTGNQARVQRYENQLLPYAVAVVEKSRRAFQEGKASILIPINAQDAYMRSRLGYLQALMDYQNAISDLEQAVGAGL